METEIEYNFTLTSDCTCRSFDPFDTEKGIDFNPEDCFGNCWDEQVQDFIEITKELFNCSETSWWKILNMKLWDGDYSGYFYADDVRELIKGMTVNGHWNMTGTVFNNRIEYSLSHHDAMGSNTTLTNITEQERQDWGLY